MRRRDLVPTDPYFAAWHEYVRTRRKGTFLPLMLFFGGAVVTSIVIDGLAPNTPPLFIPLAMVPFVLAAIVTSQPLVRWPCPRCAKPFMSWSRGGYNGFTRRCLNCGLPKWAPRDPSTQG